VNTFEPRLSVLPPSQQKLWPELHQVPKHFVLYGGTAISLRLGHRASLDFDFFSAVPFEPERLQQELAFAATPEVVQKSANTLTIRTLGTDGVRLSFFGGLTFGQMEPPTQCPGNMICVASLCDLMATKLNTVYQRAEAKDYLDIYAMLDAGCTLAQGLGSARAIYRTAFNPMLPLKALTFFDDGDLPSLPTQVKVELVRAVEGVTEIPIVRAFSDRITTPR
jgi:hypothetical protein